MYFLTCLFFVSVRTRAHQNTNSKSLNILLSIRLPNDFDVTRQKTNFSSQAIVHTICGLSYGLNEVRTGMVKQYFMR